MAILESIKGVFSGEDKKEDAEKTSNPNTPEQQKLYDMAWQDYQVFKEKRQEIEPVWKEEDRFYEGGRKQWEGLRSEETLKARPNSVDNIAFSQIESIVSALTGWVPEGKFEPTEPGDDQKAQDLAKYMPYELRQIKFKPKHVKAVRRFVIHGLLLYKTVYDPTIEGGRGNNRFIGQNDIIPLDYGSFFPDPRIGDLLYLQQSKAMIIHTVKDLEYFAERFGEQGKKVQEDNLSSDVEIFDTNKTDTVTYKAKRSGLIEYWYKGKPKIVSKEEKALFRQQADETLAEGKDPSVYIARERGTAKGVHCLYISTSGVFLEHKSYVYDHGNYPVTARCLFPVEGTIWPKGYMRDLISPQIMLNKFSELAVEQTAKLGNDAMMYEEGAIDSSKQKIWKRMRSQVAAMLPVGDINKVKEIKGAAPNPGIMQFIQHWLGIMQKIPRRFDSANGGTAPNVKSGEHAEALQAAAQGHLSTPAELIEDGLVEVFEQYIELIAQFYKTDRIGRVLGREVGMSRDRLLSQAQSEVIQQVPDELGQMTEVAIPVIEEYVPQFDISVSIGVGLPKDREYWIQTAWQLFQQQMIDAKAVQYTVEHGRMEPFEIIEARMQKDMQIQQQLEATMAENEQLKGMLQEYGVALEQSEAQNQTDQVEAAKIAQEQEREQFNRSVQERKLNIDEMNAASKLVGVR